MSRLVLKTTSPRRKKIFKEIGLSFDAVPSQINEDVFLNESPLAYLERVTRDKLEIHKAESSNIYVSSDTIVVLREKIYGKPLGNQEAVQMLEELKEPHLVYSSLGFYASGAFYFAYDSTTVYFKNWSRVEIEEYVTNAKPFDKAGGYGIQDENGPVLRWEGSYTNVMGFPLRKFYEKNEVWRQFLSL